MTTIKTFSVTGAKKLFKRSWDPKDVTKYAGLVLRVAKFEGKYGTVQHVHKYDEFFLVLEGKIEIHVNNEIIKLDTFDGATIPAGIYHQPFAKKPALVLMLDPNKQYYG